MASGAAIGYFAALRKDDRVTKLQRKLGRLGKRLIKDGGNSAQTLAVRLPMLAKHPASVGEAFERSRMVTEKVDAAAQGAMAAGFAIGSFWLKAMTGRVRSPADVVAGMLDVASAATAPASRKVAANARRLKRG